jgi:lysophospholipid acyltransferase (LPLAT)-like uncharacterized protein
MSTLDHKWALYDPTVDAARPDCLDPKIYLVWHEYLLAPLYLRGHCNITMLLSRHRDAEYLARIAYHMGFACVRGSTNRGAARALRELARRSERTHLTVTPDGPLGPRRGLAAGPIFLASKLGLPLVLLGIGYDRPWRLKTWDRFAIPRVGSRSRTVVSPAILIPADLDRDGIELYRQEIERLMNRLTLEAESWAEAGTTKREEISVRREATLSLGSVLSCTEPRKPEKATARALPPAA